MNPMKNSPIIKETLSGDYYWCACGQTASEPFCDGSHSAKNTGKKPVLVTIDKDKKVAWCGCKKSLSAPFCDGSHQK